MNLVMGGADTKYSIFLIRETNRLKTVSELSEFQKYEKLDLHYLTLQRTDEKFVVALPIELSRQLGLLASLIQFRCTKYFRDDLTLFFEDAQCFDRILKPSLEICKTPGARRCEFQYRSIQRIFVVSD